VPDLFESSRHKETRWERARHHAKITDIPRRIGLACVIAVITGLMSWVFALSMGWRVVVALVAGVSAIPIWLFIEHTFWFFRLPRTELEEENERLRRATTEASESQFDTGTNPRHESVPYPPALRQPTPRVALRQLAPSERPDAQTITDSIREILSPKTALTPVDLVGEMLKAKTTYEAISGPPLPVQEIRSIHGAQSDAIKIAWHPTSIGLAVRLTNTSRQQIDEVSLIIADVTWWYDDAVSFVSRREWKDAKDFGGVRLDIHSGPILYPGQPTHPPINLVQVISADHFNIEGKRVKDGAHIAASFRDRGLYRILVTVRRGNVPTPMELDFRFTDDGKLSPEVALHGNVSRKA